MKLKEELIIQYLRVCAEQKKLDPKTIKAYRIDLRQFREFAAGHGGGFDRETLKTYISYMNTEYQPRTVKRKIASLRAMSTWLEEEGLLPQNPFSNLHVKIREPQRLPKVIPLRVIGDLLEEAHSRIRRNQDNPTALRDAAVLELLFATGMRVSELCGLQTRDLDLTDGVIRIFGKGAKERILQVTNYEVLSLLRRYVRVCQPERDGAFFRNRLGGRLSDQSVRRIVRNYASLIRSAVRITPHMFRHSFATLLLEEDVDIRCIQQILGHSSILTTQIYTNVAGAKQRDIFLRKHPRNQFSFLEYGDSLPPKSDAFREKVRDNTLLSFESQD